MVSHRIHIPLSFSMRKDILTPRVVGRSYSTKPSTESDHEPGGFVTGVHVQPSIGICSFESMRPQSSMSRRRRSNRFPNGRRRQSRRLFCDLTCASGLRARSTSRGVRNRVPCAQAAGSPDERRTTKPCGTDPGSDRCWPASWATSGHAYRSAAPASGTTKSLLHARSVRR